MHGEHEHHDGGGDAKGFHGMVLWGLDSIYLSHLPMFKAPPHAYQVIIEGRTRSSHGRSCQRIRY
jgi:hypothetical protein